MKNKTFLFSNFKFEPNKNNNDSLSICNVRNINTENGFIKTEFQIKNVLQSLFSDTNSSVIIQNNIDILNTSKQFIPYSFFNEETGTYDYKIFTISHNNQLFELNKKSYIFELRYDFINFPKIIYAEDNIYLFDDEICVIINNANSLQIENIPKIKSHLQFNNLLYFCFDRIPNRVFITDSCDIKDLSKNINLYDSIIIPSHYGPIIKITNIKNKIYFVTKYSILKLNPEDNKLSELNKLELEIYNNMVEQIDDTIFFYSSNGLCCFNGSSVEQIFNIPLDVNKNANFINFNQNLYIYANDFNKAIYKYNPNNNSLTSLEINNLVNLYLIKCNDLYNLCACTLNENQYTNTCLYTDSNDTLFQSINFNTTSLGSPKNKQLNKILFNCDGEFVFKIKTDITETQFTINNQTKLENLLINGTLFDFHINANSKIQINSIVLSFDEVEE